MHYDDGQWNKIMETLMSFDNGVGVVFIASLDKDTHDMNFNFVSRLEFNSTLELMQDFAEQLAGKPEPDDHLTPGQAKPELKLVTDHATMEEENQGNKATPPE